MFLSEREIEIKINPDKILTSDNTGRNLIHGLSESVKKFLQAGEVPIRFIVSSSDRFRYRCEIGLMVDQDQHNVESIFKFVPRRLEVPDKFTTVLIVPTGVGAEIGGHAGDATPVASLLASVSDSLITHPNVVNASDIIDLPQNALYVEGSVLTRLLMGTVGLLPVRRNRILVVLDSHEDQVFMNAAINAVNAARVSYGLSGVDILEIDPCFVMDSSFTSSGRATGRVHNLDLLTNELKKRVSYYDAVALSSRIIVPENYHTEYFELGGDMVNPWGGVEALLTHAVSTVYNVPSAHSPMMETQDIANMDPGIVDPRMAAEAISLTFLQCILKGLKSSPRILTDTSSITHRSALTAEDISCVVIPDGCLGLPTLAALSQGIPVIAVRENKTLMSNDLGQLPWMPGQLNIVDSYLEAAGVIGALKAGIDPMSVKRPIESVNVDKIVGELPETVIERMMPF